jgi:hypothetical protein
MKRALIFAAALLAAALAGPARAGTYVVRACGTGGVNHAWHATTPPPGVMETNEACHADPTMDGIWVRDVLASSTDLTDGQGAWLQFLAPTGTTIAGIAYKRWLWKDSIDDLQPELRTADGTTAISFTGLSTTRIEAGVWCQITPPASYCAGGGTQHGYGAVITDAAVTIEDDTPPAAPSVAASGLWSGADWYRGDSAVTISGSDASGIAAVRVDADGQLLTEQAGACDYTYAKPCADAADLVVPIDTTQLADGEHDIGVTLLDAAGNESPAITRTVLVANDPPGTPQLTITPPQSTSPSFTASWTPAPGHMLGIALAHVTVCRDFVMCTETTTSASSVQLSAPAPGITTVSVYLEDVAGNVDPANAASKQFAYAPVQPPTSDPGTRPPLTGTTTPSSGPEARLAPRLKLSGVAGRERVRVIARLVRAATGRVVFEVRWRHARPVRGRRWTRWHRCRRSIRHGHAVLVLRRTPRRGRVQILARYRGNSRVQAGAARRMFVFSP